MKIQVDDLRGIRPGYTIGIPMTRSHKWTLFGAFEGILQMTEDHLQVGIGGNSHWLHRARIVEVFGPEKLLTAEEAVRLWEDHVGDSGGPPTDEDLQDFANAVLRSVGIR